MNDTPERIYIDADYDAVEHLGHGGFFTGRPVTGEVVEYIRADLLTTIRQEERRAAFKDALGLVASLPARGTMNYRRGYEEGVRDAIRTLEAAANETREDGDDG